MTITINIDGKDFEMNYAGITKLAKQVRWETAYAMEQMIKNSKNGMTASELKNTFGINGSQLWGLTNTICYNGSYSYYYRKQSRYPINYNYVEKTRHFAEVDNNGKLIENGSVMDVTKKERLYTYNK